MSIKPSPLAGALVASGLLAMLGLVLRIGATEAPSPARPIARGGQLVASIRSEPRTFNGLISRDHTSEMLRLLMQAQLVRINRHNFALEPWLAERWESSADGRTHTLHLRTDVTWSDGTPFTAADVLFSLQAVFDPKVESDLASMLTVAGQPIRATAPDQHTVIVIFAGPSGPGLRILDNLVIEPRHKLEPALAGGTFATTWSSQTQPDDIVGLGPFLLRDYQPGQRIVLDRNPRYWRKAPDGQSLPYLDRIVLEIVPDQNVELVRLQSGELDLTNSELRPEDVASVRRSDEEGRLTTIELGTGINADAFWFCLNPDVKKTDPRFAFVQKPEFRQAISHAVDRQAFAETVFLGAAVPIWGPITPGNQIWYSPDVPRYAHDDTRARALLKSIGLEDRDGNQIVEDAHGTEARFTVLTQRGVGSYERGTAVLRTEAAGVGIALDIVPLEFGAMIQRMLACDYDAIYMRPLFTDLDPAGNLDFWLSSGSAHFWNLEQKAPATEWERRLDAIMLEQVAALDEEQRQRLFRDVQRLMAENVPALYFAAPRMYYAHSARMRGVTPSVVRPPALWTADSLSVAR